MTTKIVQQTTMRQEKWNELLKSIAGSALVDMQEQIDPHIQLYISYARPRKSNIFAARLTYLLPGEKQRESFVLWSGIVCEWSFKFPRSARKGFFGFVKNAYDRRVTHV